MAQATESVTGSVRVVATKARKLEGRMSSDVTHLRPERGSTPNICEKKKNLIVSESDTRKTNYSVFSKELLIQ